MADATATREDTHYVSVNIDGRDLGWFDTLSGGEIDSEESSYRPGGGAGVISLGGAVTYGNVTVGRYLSWARDWPIMGWLVSRAGRGRATIGRIPVDIDGNVRGAPLVYTGTLKQVNPGDLDSTGTDAAILELECTVESVAAA